MEFFSKLRRSHSSNETHESHEPVAAAVLPDINTRVTVWVQGHAPVPSRVEDVLQDELVISSPSLPMAPGDPVSVSWAGELAWFTLETSVTGVDDDARPPCIAISTHGRLSRRDDRRGDQRTSATLPLELRAVMTRVIKTGQVLNTQTVEVGEGALRFATSSPLAPGDVLEARVDLPDGPVGARVRVIRMDAVAGSWRQTCTAAYDEILASDRERILAFVEGAGASSGSGSGSDVALHDF